MIIVESWRWTGCGSPPLSRGLRNTLSIIEPILNDIFDIEFERAPQLRWGLPNGVHLWRKASIAGTESSWRITMNARWQGPDLLLLFSHDILGTSDLGPEIWSGLARERLADLVYEIKACAPQALRSA